MKQSAGLLLYREIGKQVEVLLVHPGGPFWAKKDAGAWSIPKGEFQDGEEAIAAARREFSEELGAAPPEGEIISLGFAKQSSGKVVYAWAQKVIDFDISNIHSNTVTLEWPPKSGKMQEFPEVDKAAWLPTGRARQKLVKGQVPLLDALVKQLGVTAEASEPTETQTTLF